MHKTRSCERCIFHVIHCSEPDTSMMPQAGEDFYVKDSWTLKEKKITFIRLSHYPEEIWKATCLCSSRSLFILGDSVEVPAPHPSQVLTPGLLYELKELSSLQSLYVCVTYEVMLEDHMTCASLKSQHSVREKDALLSFVLKTSPCMGMRNTSRNNKRVRT